MSSRLVYSDRGHTYSLDGKRVPGVTTVIRNATPKDALAPAAARETALWAAVNVAALDTLGTDQWVRTASSAYRDAWAAKRDLGTRVHVAAQRMVAGEHVIPADPDTGEAWGDDERRMVEQVARFMDEWKVQPLAVERPVFNDDDRWAGTVDLVARLVDGRRWLIDFKTGGSGIWPEHAVQLAAYRHATHLQVERQPDTLDDWPMPAVDACACVWVRPDGYELRPVRADAALYDVFRSMLPVADWSTWKRDESIFDPVPAP